MGKKLIVIGLDCASPQLVFEKYRNDLPNINGLLKTGLYADLESVIPPITVPAWMSMVTGKDPGKLGVYGFRNRANYSYNNLSIANSSYIHEKTVWERLSDAGKKVIVLGVPQTYPTSKVNGLLVSGFLTPGIDSNYTYPIALKEEIKEKIGDYIIDVKDFRTDDKDSLLQNIYEMTKRRFQLADYLMSNHPWDFFMMVEMGVDRIHHGFWKYCDEDHPKYVPGNKYESVIKEYYCYIDKLIGVILKKLDEDTSILIVSDHGAKTMLGGICINEWLIKKGYLSVYEYPKNGIIQLDNSNINWQKTRVWASGGYYARIFFNVEGREPQGIIKKNEYDVFRQQIKKEIEEICGPKKEKLQTKAYIPQEIYKTINNIPPDLIVLFDDLSWRSVGSIGFPDIYTFENDTGPDDANHAQHGIFILKSAQLKKQGRIPPLKITDCSQIMADLVLN
ncbi:alkaline phosphatase family protein [Chlamydiota bacterium]